MRTRTSAHLPGSAASECADLPVRIGLRSGLECGRGRPRTSPVRRRGGARTSRSALGFAAGWNADEDVRAPPGFGGVGVRGPPGPHGLAAGLECGPGRPRTSPVRRRRGARTSRSALGLAAGWNADGDVRAPPRFGGVVVRGPPGPHWVSQQAWNADEDVRAPPGFRGVVVRGPPGPHWVSQQAGMRTRTSAHLPGSAAWWCADLPVRIGFRSRLECGRGRPRTRSEPAFFPGEPCGFDAVADAELADGLG